MRVALTTEQCQSTAQRPSRAPADAEITIAVRAQTELVQPAAAVPSQLGRYIVLEQVGEGGMGRVFRAYDPKLRREVALKLLMAPAGESEGAARTVREAQAMARLSHPNLVPVYDVEQDGDAVFIAMEYVEGDTLRSWLDRGQLSWREVVAAYVGAGRGLAAAHAAGIVHRDFKPSNAMIGSDARVRVMDFGLARGVSVTENHDADDLAPVFAELAEVTRTGTIIGTAAYMAPEQHDGGAVVAASDQYAFCVALFEALFGERPFVGADLTALIEVKRRGVPQVPVAAARDVPQWLRAAVVRGLAVEAGKRWPTMDALLEVLERGQARARTRRVLTGVGALVLGGAAVAVVVQLEQRQRIQACMDAGASISTVWDNDVRTRLRAALVATGVSHAATTADKVMPWLDAQAAAWQHARTEACLDEDVRGRWDADTLDRALWCLDERRMELQALVSELVDADAAVVHRAVTAAAGLDSIEACRDAGLLERLPRPPPAESRDSIQAVRVELSRARALRRTGAYAEGLALARSAHQHSERLGWPPLKVAAGARVAGLLERQGAYEQAEQVAAQAYFEAARIGAWDTAADVAVDLILVVGSRRARHADGFVWGRHAEVALGYAADPQGLREADRVANLAGVHNASGEYAQARTLYERAIAIYENALGPEHPVLGLTLSNLANVYAATGEYTQAQARHERAVAISEKALGADHPEVAATLGNFANLYSAIGESGRARTLRERVLVISERALGSAHPDVAKALVNLANAHAATGEHVPAVALYERALAILVKAVGPNHPDVATCLEGLANVDSATGEYAQARTRYERALAIREATHGLEHPDVAKSLNNLAVLHDAAGEYAQARTLHERALAIRDKALGPDHPQVAASLNNLALVLSATGEYARAGTLQERAVAIYEKAFGPDHPDVAACLNDLAAVRVATGDDVVAVGLLERAIAIYDGRPEEQTGELEARFALAKALVATGGDTARARGLAELARDGWRTAGTTHAKDLALVERWLATLVGIP